VGSNPTVTASFYFAKLMLHQGDQMKKLFAIALTSLLLLGSAPAVANPKKCTSSQTAAINSQTSIVTSYQRTVTNDTKKSRDAAAVLQKANANATALNAKIIASQRKITELLAGVTKNANTSPSIARGYQSQAESEAKNLRALQSSYKWATTDVANATKVANSTTSALKTSTSNLAFQQKKLNDLTSKCRR
jgi:hypothetical protein